MISWFLPMLVLFGFLLGCGGGPQGGLVKDNQSMPVIEPQATESEESLAEELTPKRLEELYARSGIPGWDQSLEAELKQLDQQLKFDVPIQINRQVRAYLVYFSTERKEIFNRYLSRSTRYLPMIKEIFMEQGLPEDLAYLAMIESGFNPHAYSRASACGMWQFIRGTGLRYGLSIDSYLDERRDPEKATRAAANYLSDLYKQFGSWYLAAASYNCGEGRVQKELDQSNHKNFWELSDNQCLPNETKNYVPQMIAATIIAKNPEKFGFKKVPYLPPLQYEKVKVDEPTSLRAAAVAVNVPLEELQLLNPALRRGVTPPDAGSYTLNLPKASGELLARNITLARIDFPAVAERPTRVAGSYRRSSSDRDTSKRSAAASRKAAKKRKTVAARARKKGPAHLAYARKDKSPHGGSAQAGSAPQTASMLGASAPARKGQSAGKAKSQATVTHKTKAKSQFKKNNGKKPEKKGEVSQKSTTRKPRAAYAGKKRNLSRSPTITGRQKAGLAKMDDRHSSLPVPILPVA